MTMTITQLPEISQLSNGNYLVVQTDTATGKLDFRNLIIGLPNVTFASTISANSTNIASLSSQVAALSGIVVNAILPIGALTITVNNTDPGSYIWSTSWSAVSALSGNGQNYTWQRTA